MAKAAPSILAADFAYLAEDCKRVCQVENPILHVDIMDGIFVPNISIGPVILQSLKRVLPDVYYDVHMMIINPLNYIDVVAQSGADSITFHYETETDINKIINKIKALKLKAGISLKPKTNIEEIFPFLDYIDMILVMSVEPGFGGQEFMPDAAVKISKLKKEIKKRNLNVIIEVDGGINEQTGKICSDAGADILVAGSYIFNSDNPLEKIKLLER